jgi:DNA recombination protein RmuC
VARSISSASAKTRTIERRLRGVESLPQEQSVALLGEAIEIEEDIVVSGNNENE